MSGVTGRLLQAIEANERARDTAPRFTHATHALLK